MLLTDAEADAQGGGPRQRVTAVDSSLAPALQVRAVRHVNVDRADEAFYKGLRPGRQGNGYQTIKRFKHVRPLRLREGQPEATS
jgi:hypothetical protein